jgi:hypothetical protein
MSSPSLPPDNLNGLLSSLLALDGSDSVAGVGAPSQAPRGSGGLGRGYEINLPSGESSRNVVPPRVYTVEENMDEWTLGTTEASTKRKAFGGQDDSFLQRASASTAFSFQGGGGKSLGMFILPTDLQAYTGTVRSFIGKGNTFCLRRDCPIVHRAEGLATSIRPGDVVVEKTANQAAYLDPRISSEKLDSSLLGDWLSSQDSLEVWHTRFSQAEEAYEATDRKTTASAASLEIIRAEEEKSVRFRTPKKARRDDSDLGPDVGLSPYSENLINGFEEFADKNMEEKVERLVQAAIDLDHGLGSTSEYTLKMAGDVAKIHSDALMVARALETNIRLQKRTLGERPTDLPVEDPQPSGKIGESKFV